MRLPDCQDDNRNPPAGGNACLSRFFAACQSAVFRMMPLGYEDETGFHFSNNEPPEEAQPSD
jgi:hypothetical protein